MNFINQELLAGFVSGCFQSLIGQPLDTIKVLLQGEKSIHNKYHFIKKNNFKLFNGLTPNIISSTFITGIQFYSYENYSPIMLGLISTLLTTPIDFYKIQKQKFNKYPKQIPNGFMITFCREVIALNCYFNLYKYLEKTYGVFLSGGIAGSTSWLITYQIDTIKTRIQSGETFENAVKKGNFNNGLLFCLLRGFLVNGFGYLGASLVKK